VGWQRRRAAATSAEAAGATTASATPIHVHRFRIFDTVTSL
jgi:hypothetical protein